MKEHITMKKFKVAKCKRLLAPLVLSALLSACSALSPTSSSFDVSQPPTWTVQAYLQQAQKADGVEKNDLLILALKASIKANQWSKALELIQQLSKGNFTQIQSAELQLAKARYWQAQKNDDLALNSLVFQPNWQLYDRQWVHYHLLRSELFRAKAQYVNAANELMDLQSFMQSADQKLNQSNLIWHDLNQYSLEQLELLPKGAAGTPLNGWLTLVKYNKVNQGNLFTLQKQLKAWLVAHPNHQAALYMPTKLAKVLTMTLAQPVNTALLLPLSAQFSQTATLIRDGFIYEMIKDKEKSPNTSLTVIDTSKYSLEQIKQQLIDKKIDFIVGPLLKDNVEAVEKMKSELTTPIRMLALNIPDTPLFGQDICYLALSPEQEAAQAAIHLSQTDHQYPLIFVPKGALGERIYGAFVEKWKELAKTPVAVSYFTNRATLQKNVNEALGIQDSQRRIAQINSMVQVELETKPRSRRDIDAIYIYSHSAELTLIKPFIEVAINPDAKQPDLFTSSLTNTGRPSYEDLSNVSYSDIPLLINPAPSVRTDLASIWPNDSNSQLRLRAMGMDAYTLTQKLLPMMSSSITSLDGHVGRLSLDDHCVVQRELSWAKYGAATQERSAVTTPDDDGEFNTDTQDFEQSQ